LEILVLLPRQSPEGGEVNDFSPLLQDVFGGAELCDEGLSAGGGAGHDEVLPIQNLRLDGLLLGRVELIVAPLQKQVLDLGWYVEL
jgi:hypothetical protein